MYIYKENRTLSPHLRSYKPQVTSVVSIFHRITGSLLGVILLCFPIGVNLIESFSSFNFIYILFAYFIFLLKIFIYLVLATFFFHCMNGLRHIMWDFCIGLDLNNLFISGCLVIFLSLTLVLSFILF
jgi:succinate dehydrogenase / fumarate reductase cytochrome b subunit